MPCVPALAAWPSQVPDATKASHLVHQAPPAAVQPDAARVLPPVQARAADAASRLQHEQLPHERVAA